MTEPMRVAFVTPEFYGRAMVGGLAMATAGLAHGLREKGIDVRVFIPQYERTARNAKFLPQQAAQGETDERAIPIHEIPGRFVGGPVSYSVGTSKIEEAAYRASTRAAFHAAIEFTEKTVRALEDLAKADSPWIPDVVHVHDWYAGPTTYFITKSATLSGIPTVITIHNAGYVGEVPCDRLEKNDCTAAAFLKAQRHALQIKGELFTSLLEMGIHFADATTTVSPTYAARIMGQGSDIDGRVAQRMREKNMEAILNGLDYGLMNPQTDPYIFRFDPTDMESTAYGKGTNKYRLHQRLGISPERDGMQVTLMARLEEQKGIDVVMQAMGELTKIEGVYLLIIGETGNDQLRRQLCEMNGNTKGRPYFAPPELQHLVLAGSDAILHPSRNEPCGLVVLEGMRYGALPIVTSVDGHADTVIPFDGQQGYGFMISELTPQGIVHAVTQARDTFSKGEPWRKALGNVLREDFSWNGPRDPVGKYIELYERVVAQKKTAT